MEDNTELLKKLHERINKSIDKLSFNKLVNPFYGKEIYFFDGCVKPILERNQLLGYLGAFSGNNKELISKINYAVLPESSYRNLNNLIIDDDLKILIVLLGIVKKREKNKRDHLPYTNIIPESIFFKRVFEFVKSDRIKLRQFNKVNFTNVI